MNNNEGRIKLLTDILEMGDDQSGKVLFTDKKFLANFLKYLFPIFSEMSVDEIIKQSIDWGNSVPGFLVKPLSEENNLRLGSQLRRDLVILLRFPDYLQEDKNERFFIFHADFENSNNKKRIERRSEEYFSDLYHTFNIAPFENEEERQKYHIPIYSVWILLNPSGKDRGHIHRSGYEVVERINESGTGFEFIENRKNTRALVNRIKIYLDDDLNEEQSNSPNIQSLLQGFRSGFNQEDFEKWLKLFDFGSLEFSEEVGKMNAFKEAFIDVGMKQGVDKGKVIGFDEAKKKDLQSIKKFLLNKGMCKSENEAEAMAEEMLNYRE